MVDECYCEVNAYSLKGTCECEENCTCDCAVCDCDAIDLWYADIAAPCSCGDNCSCEQTSNEVP